MISNIRVNALGTISLVAQFPGMDKPATFASHPIAKDRNDSRLVIEAPRYLGGISLQTGAVRLLGPSATRLYVPHLPKAAPIYRISGEELLMIKIHLAMSRSMATAPDGFNDVCNLGSLKALSIEAVRQTA